MFESLETWTPANHVAFAQAMFLAAAFVYVLQAWQLAFAGRLLRLEAMRDHVAFALSAAAYCVGCLVVTLHSSTWFTMRVAHVNWISATLIYVFYIRSLRSFTGIRLRSIAVCERIFEALVALVAADLLLLLLTNRSLLFDPVPFNTPNILFAAVGGNLYTATGFMQGTMLVVFVASAWMDVAFTRALLRAPRPDRLLIFGTILSLFGLANELAIVLVPATPLTAPYLAWTTSLLWLTNLPELVRITSHYQRRTRELVESLARDRTDLERAAALSTIAGSIAHDVANPLSVIQLQLAGLQRAGIAPTQQRAVDQIHRNSRRIRDIVAGYLKLTGDSGSVRRERVACRDLLTEAVTLAEPRMREYGAPLVEVHDSETAHVDCQRTLVELALTNLLTNAARAVHGRPDARILARIDATDDEIHVRIVDTGPGFDLPFEQVVSGREVTPRPGGHGIGLRTAKRIVESQGGQLELEHAQPTTLRLTLPRAQ